MSRLFTTGVPVIGKNTDGCSLQGGVSLTIYNRMKGFQCLNF